MRYYTFLIIVIFFSCKNESSENTTQNYIDSLKIVKMVEVRTDSLLNNSLKNRFLDTIGVSSSPVVVLKSKFVNKEYSNYKDIELSYKNVSNKDIVGIRFEWYGENVFKEPAEMGDNYLLGSGSGFTDKLLTKGNTASGIWEISSKDGHTILTTRAYEVMFKDGTKWKLRKHN